MRSAGVWHQKHQVLRKHADGSASHNKNLAPKEIQVYVLNFLQEIKVDAQSPADLSKSALRSGVAERKREGMEATGTLMIAVKASACIEEKYVRIL